MEKTLLKKYVEIRTRREELEAQEGELRTDIVNAMQRSGQEKIVGDLGSFTVATKSKWTYSPKVKKLEDAVKIEKQKEQEKGIALSEETNYLLFKPVKEEI